MEKKSVTLQYSESLDCTLRPDFWRVLAPDGSFLWNHYQRGISRATFCDWYQLSSDVVFQGVTDGRVEGLQIQLSPSEFRRVADRCYGGFRFWRLGEAA